MTLLCYRRQRFPPEIIQHAIWLYLRFTLSNRAVDELLAARGKAPSQPHDPDQSFALNACALSLP